MQLIDSEPSELDSHIPEKHYRPSVLATLGVPVYDIERAYIDKALLQNSIDVAQERLEESGFTIQERMLALFSEYEQLAHNPLLHYESLYHYSSIEGYKSMFVKTLMYMQLLERGKIDWNRVIHAFPQTPQVTLNLRTDSKDGTFLTLKQRLEIPQIRPILLSSQPFSAILLPSLSLAPSPEALLPL